MALRDELVKRIERKQADITELEIQIREARAYLQGLQDMLRLVPKEHPAPGEADQSNLRPDSAAAKARDAIKAAGRPIHISAILKAMGKPIDAAHRHSVSGGLSAYVRKGLIFTRPAPNTFGLLEFGETSASQVGNEPPDDFGIDEDESLSSSDTSS